MFSRTSRYSVIRLLCAVGAGFDGQGVETRRRYRTRRRGSVGGRSISPRWRAASVDRSTTERLREELTLVRIEVENEIKVWWARMESNHRPPACEADALPLSHAPDRIFECSTAVPAD